MTAKGVGTISVLPPDEVAIFGFRLKKVVGWYRAMVHIAISSLILEQFGARLTLESKPGEGTTGTITFPIKT